MVKKYSLGGQKGSQNNFEILDKLFNAQTKYFLSRHGLREGMSVLDIGCGIGLMTQFLAGNVGKTGRVVAIDISEEQIKAAKKNCPEHLKKRISWQVSDINELEEFKKKFDLVYCRFVLHNLYNPRYALSQIESTLSSEGIYIGIEGIVDSAFSIPEHSAWRSDYSPQEAVEGVRADGNIGKILPKLICEANMDCKESSIYQPLLVTSEDRKLLLYNKCIAIRQYHKEKAQVREWEEKYKNLKSCAEDDSILMAFYAANFTASLKVLH